MISVHFSLLISVQRMKHSTTVLQMSCFRDSQNIKYAKFASTDSPDDAKESIIVQQQAMMAAQH